MSERGGDASPGKELEASGAASPKAEAPSIAREDWMTKATPQSAAAVPEPEGEKQAAPEKKVGMLWASSLLNQSSSCAWMSAKSVVLLRSMSLPGLEKARAYWR